MMHQYGMGYGLLGLGWLFQLLILLLFFLVVWWMVRSSGFFGLKAGGSETAKDVLDRRLANGEISLKDYHALKKEIEQA
ncbi:hypothetical protein HYU17_05820 [Candidatus Woesearchaeota archaeon]|nr:hypothetical protein [Candidatus Woesearchaeota archaeon]